jgi:hypothetical protein
MKRWRYEREKGAISWFVATGIVRMSLVDGGHAGPALR